MAIHIEQNIKIPENTAICFLRLDNYAM